MVDQIVQGPTTRFATSLSPSPFRSTGVASPPPGAVGGRPGICRAYGRNHPGGCGAVDARIAGPGGRRGHLHIDPHRPAFRAGGRCAVAGGESGVGRVGGLPLRRPHASAAPTAGPAGAIGDQPSHSDQDLRRPRAHCLAQLCVVRDQSPGSRRSDVRVDSGASAHDRTPGGEPLPRIVHRPAGGPARRGGHPSGCCRTPDGSATPSRDASFANPSQSDGIGGDPTGVSRCRASWYRPARQEQILTLVAAGLTDAQIGRRLGLTAATVSKHLTRTYARLGVPNRAAAVGLVGQTQQLAGPHQVLGTQQLSGTQQVLRTR